MTVPLERFPTGITGLDTVLQGGLVRGGIYLVAGRPGTGKTTFGNQTAYWHAGQGERVIFATILTETHARMLAHLSGFGFIAHEEIGTHVHYVSIYDELCERGLEGVMSLLRGLVRQHEASLLVIDGAGLFRDFAPSAIDFRRFTHELCAQLGTLRCTTILLSDVDADEVFFPIGTHVDGIIVLEDESYGMSDSRTLHIVKLRGVAYLRGRHRFAITPSGITVFPRLESTLTEEAALEHSVQTGRLGFGIQELDAMLAGGVRAGSSTLLVGAPGAGKTLSGLSFAAEGARLGERALVCSFHETPDQMIEMADGIGLDYESYVRDGLIQFYWRPAIETPIDAWAEGLIDRIDEHGPRRVVIDALSDIQRLTNNQERLTPFLMALVDKIRARSATTVFVTEVPLLVGGNLDMPNRAVAPAAENVILLRYVELRSQLRRLVSVLKMRGSDHDTSIREFNISDSGITVNSTFDSAEAILTGAARSLTPASRRSEGARGEGE